MVDLAPNASRFEPAGEVTQHLWADFCVWPDQTSFPKFLGLTVEEIKVDYARLRLPYRREYCQPAGVVHGGAIASLIDTCVVPAVASPFDHVPQMLTLSMTINYTGALAESDAIAEGWVTKRGRSIVFCESSVIDTSGRPVASASLVYKVRPASPAA